jgi:DmsE family decaheme c-type cytochrome
MEPTVVLAREPGTAPNQGEDRGGKYLAFHLGREEFGIRVPKVLEIIGIRDIMAAPRTPPRVKGVIQPPREGDSGGGSAAQVRPAGAGVQAADLHHCSPGAGRGGALVGGDRGGALKEFREPPMQTCELELIISESAAEVLETMCFTTLAAEAEAPEACAGPWISARLAFHGGASGRFGVGVPPGTSRAMAAGILALALLAGGAIPVFAQPDRQGADASAYAGSNACQECHKQGYRRFSASKMAKVFFEAPRGELESRGCEACHGPGRQHIDTEKARDAARAAGTTYTGPKSSEFIVRFGKDSPLPARDQNDRCLQCHEKGQRLFWQGSAHESRGLACVTCHQVHQNAPPPLAAARFTASLTSNLAFTKRTAMEVCFDCHPMRKAQLQRSSHMPLREGGMTCASCHNPHGSPNPTLLVAASVNQTCYKCHPERRGPFLWEHPPVMENCLNCHEAHGSARPQLLKVSPPRLCQECHTATGHPGTPQLATVRFVFNRGCTNCHSLIHGSNHPSGSRFQR